MHPSKISYGYFIKAEGWESLAVGSQGVLVSHVRFQHGLDQVGAPGSRTRQALISYINSRPFITFSTSLSGSCVAPAATSGSNAARESGTNAVRLTIMPDSFRAAV